MVSNIVLDFLPGQMIPNLMTAHILSITMQSPHIFVDKSLGPIPLSVYGKKRYYNRRSKSIKIVFLWSKKGPKYSPLIIYINVSHGLFVEMSIFQWCHHRKESTSFWIAKMGSILWPFRTRCLDWSSGDRVSQKGLKPKSLLFFAPENGWWDIL